jgi:hypothetical protein
MHADRRSLYGALLLWVSISGPTPATSAAPAQQVSRGGAVAAGVEIEIYNLSGSVQVTGWDRNEVGVEGSLGAGAERLDFDNEGDRVEIRVVAPRARRGDSQPREVGESHLRIMVPDAAALEIETLAASITVTGVSGPLSMASSAGSITYSGDAAAIEAESAAGDVHVETTSTRADIDVEGIAGNIVVQLAGGRVDASSVTGSLRILGRVDEGHFESVSGSMYFEGSIPAGGELDFENFNGDIELLIPGDTAAAFEIHTYSGSISTEFGHEGRRADRYSPEQEAEFALGDGDRAHVSVETFSGSVRVRRR